MRYDTELSTSDYMSAIYYWSRAHKERPPQAFFEGIYYYKHIRTAELKAAERQQSKLRWLIKPFDWLKNYITSLRRKEQL